MFALFDLNVFCNVGVPPQQGLLHLHLDQHHQLLHDANNYFHLVKPVKVLTDARKQDQEGFLNVQQVEKLV